MKKENTFLKISISILLIGITISLGILMFNLSPSVQAQNNVVIKQGASGNQVKQIQLKLNEQGFNCGKADGIFGWKTTDAVKKFQAEKGIKADGIVGKATAKALGIELSNSASGNSSYNSSDIYLLAKCVYAESRGEPYIGQVAVAAVVLNRVRSSKFPNSISGVIYQPYAFTAVNDGQINLSPNESAFSAARDAMNGWDPTNGCIYYFNPSTATSSWIWSRPIALKIGKHNFAN